MRNRYVRTRRWVGAACAAAFVAVFGALFARDQQATAKIDEAVLAPVTVASNLPAATPTQTPRSIPQRNSPSATQPQPSARSVPSATPQPSKTTTAPHTRTRAS